MDANEEHVKTLLSMGFPSEPEIRKALRLGKNDLNEAVAYLTNEHPSSSYDALDDLDVEMKDTTSRALVPAYGPAPPPSYDEVVEPERDMTEDPGINGDTEVESGPYEFPVTNLYELEGRVFTDSWSIPYKKEESLGKCLIAATRLAQEGLSDSDEYCTRFMDRCMPEAFQKLLTSAAVHRWGTDIQEGIYTMLQLLVDLVATRLQHQPVPVGLLGVLSTCINMENEFHFKNKARKADRLYWEDKLGSAANLYAISPTLNSYKDPYGWLTNLLNRFGLKGGYECIKQSMATQNLDAPSMAALLQPFGNCAEYLNPKVMQVVFAPGMEKAVRYVQELEENDLKEKKVGSVSDMLATMKLLCLHMWPNDVKGIDELRLDIALRMLKSPHFNARMNSLKEVTKLIEDSCSSKQTKTAIPSEVILDWLGTHNVLSKALEGNIDQAQYCDKIKGIVEFVGSRLSEDELTKIWRMQNGQTNNVIDNIHSIIAAASIKFTAHQLEILFPLIQKSWQIENDRMREKLLSLIGKIGKDARSSTTTTRVLELLWDLAHLPALPTSLIEQALEEHLSILSDAYTAVKDQNKRHYVDKCVEDIKKGVWVLPALKQLLHISKNIAKSSFHKTEKGILHELNKNVEIIKLVTNSLVKCHKVAVSAAVDKECKVSPDLLVDGRYTHQDYVSVHLSFLQFILQEGVLYLPWHRARDMWETLVVSSEACEWDRETCFEWFTKGNSDLDSDTQSQLFQKEVLRLDAATLSVKGFACFRNFFENVNMYDNRLKKSGTVFMVEKAELQGIEYLWEICLNTTSETIADLAVQLLLNMSYMNLTPRLKKDLVNLHKKFIKECYSRLEAAMITMGGSAIAQALSMATKIITAATVPEVATVPSPSRSAKLQNIERLLLIAERYILAVEESHTVARTIFPHGASFQGYPVTMNIVCDSPKMEFTIQGHRNMTVSTVRQKIATHLKTTPDQIQIVANDKMLGSSRDQRLIHQMEFADNQVLIVRAFTSGIGSGSPETQTKEAPGTPSKQSFDLEQEKMLPGVVMAMGGHVFDMLYQLADLEEPKITVRVRKLLQLIPTDQSVQDSLDSLGHKHLRQPSPDDLSPRVSPRASPKKTLPPPPPPAASMQPASPKTAGAKELLQALFDSTSNDMSTFRVLYNLEVLSSKLMPVSQDAATIQSAKSFCDDFMSSGGLSLVVNVLQKDAVAADVDYETRQGCYAISLQLARFLLCGQMVTGEESSVLLSGRRSSNSSMGAATTAATASGVLAAAAAGASAAVAVNTVIPTLDILPSVASRTVQTMSESDFTATVACFMRVTWAAAAGRLHLVSSAQPIKESSSIYSGGRRSRQSSTGSTASTGSEGENQSLHAGVCTQNENISPTDIYIAREALELLITCLQLRSQMLGCFYSLPCVNDFIIDILVGSSQADIRTAALEQLWLLTQQEFCLPEGSTLQTPHHFLLQVLLRAHLPFWIPSSCTRGTGQRLLNQCGQYFELRCRLLERLSLSEQAKLQVNPGAMLEDEIGWLTNFNHSEHSELKETDNSLLAGHVNLIKTLLTCHGVDKKEFGSGLVPELLHEFLFPASKLIAEGTGDTEADIKKADFNPKCSNNGSRIAAYELLIELADGCPENMEALCKELVAMHHQLDPDSASEWEYMPPVDSRAVSGFVGLKNGGATCYMNSVIQQLYMAPSIPEYILGIEQDSEEETVFNQIQQVFGHLLDSKLQYYVPEKFWKVFRLWGQSVNIREQQDALDFYQALIDQLDEHLKKLGKQQVFKKKYQGVFSDQKICKDCPHRYEREEVFFALNVTVKNATLQDSLDQFVKGELLEGDNAYFCEKCGEKRNTVKRMCIKTLPPVLCIQLKRFGYDWEANRALKFDDHFKFPWVLDMEPYTAEGMSRRENQQQENGDSGVEDGLPDIMGGQGDSSQLVTTALQINTKQINYELVGVVVHSGQANAGHYYSYIKDRRGSVLTNPNRGKWFKFNDTVVEEFEMNESTLEEECFGGSYKAKVYEGQSSSYPEERLRYWNGYLLFYERMEDVKGTPVSAKKSRVAMFKRHSARLSRENPERDSLVELTELVHKGEKRGMFTDKMPAVIQQDVRDENLRFMKNRDVFNQEYFRFVRLLVSRNSTHTTDSQYPQLCLMSLQLGVQFLFNTYFRTKKKLREDMGEWLAALETLMIHCKQACWWMVQFLASEEGRSYIKPLLLECPTREIRIAIAKLLERMMANFFHHGGVTTHKCFDELWEGLLQLLNKDLPEQCKHCTQYFWLLSCYVQMGTKACAHMFGRNAFQRLIMYLLGANNGQNSGGGESENAVRRWSSLQSRDFGPLHATLATLILNCDVSHYRTEDPGSHTVYTPKTVQPQIFLKMSTEMESHVFGNESLRYIKEVTMAIREVSGNTSSVTDMLVYCSFCNATFSMQILKQIMLQYINAPSSELKNLFSLLMELLLLEDPLQLKRLQCIIDGYKDPDTETSYEGLLAVIKINHMSDSRRSYQCIKFLCTLSNKCSLAKDYLVQTPTKWQWAVNWLKKKMSEYYYPQTTSNEDSNSRSFQRTISAQDTLAEATALLTELESHENQGSEMETSNSSSGGGDGGGGSLGEASGGESRAPMEHQENINEVDEVDRL